MPSYARHPQHVSQIIQAALAAADPAVAVRDHLRRDGQHLIIGDRHVDLSDGRLFLVAVGKAALAMANAASQIAGDLVAGGVVIAKRGESTAGDGMRARLPPGLTVHYGAHPVPDESSVAATAAAIDLLNQTRPGDLVLCLISGGASALLTQPRVPLDVWQALVDALLASGCTINDLNTVRRALDRVKGGGLARLAAPAECVSLILSDVVGNPLTIIGSGPTVPGSSETRDVLTVLERYEIDRRLTADRYALILNELKHFSERDVTLHVTNIIVGDLRRAATAAVTAATALGFETQLLTVHLEGEAREIGRVAAALARDAAPDSCLILGGETTVTVRGEGQGGRNLELALAAAIAVEGVERAVVASIATDGEDGTTGAAGALVNGETAAWARRHELIPEQYLADNNSYQFFKKLDATRVAGGDLEICCLIKTGSTGTNVNDLVLILRYS